jgi:uncharacterized protein (TIGR02246 family)
VTERAAVQDQLNRYTDAVNRRDWDAFATLYAPDALWEGAGGLDMRFEGREAITRGFAAIIEPMSMFVQMNTPAVIEFRDGRAFARTTIHELGDVPAEGSRFELYGRYEDELVNSGGLWLFQARRFILMTRQTRPIPGSDLGPWAASDSRS